MRRLVFGWWWRRHGGRPVRVRLGRHLYAYRVRSDVKVGDPICIVTPYSGEQVRHVVKLGRGGYFGPLKKGWLV